MEIFDEEICWTYRLLLVFPNVYLISNNSRFSAYRSLWKPLRRWFLLKIPAFTFRSTLKDKMKGFRGKWGTIVKRNSIHFDFFPVTYLYPLSLFSAKHTYINVHFLLRHIYIHFHFLLTHVFFPLSLFITTYLYLQSLSIIIFCHGLFSLSQKYLFLLSAFYFLDSLLFETIVIQFLKICSVFSAEKTSNKFIILSLFALVAFLIFDKTIPPLVFLHLKHAYIQIYSIVATGNTLCRCKCLCCIMS